MILPIVLFVGYLIPGLCSSTYEEDAFFDKCYQDCKEKYGDCPRDIPGRPCIPGNDCARLCNLQWKRQNCREVNAQWKDLREEMKTWQRIDTTNKPRTTAEPEIRTKHPTP